ncbi:hypothetical protein [Frankia sp. Cr1]|uniref:hypothetical protein n=1 Tax=Frankia sp. Cr1 TaxID=3073931 RepID=UPI002AD30689|nr:hypothetical protein [Frankia sp. Cr1]
MTTAAQKASEPAAGDPLNEFRWADAAPDATAKIGLTDLLVRLQLMATDAARNTAADNDGWWAKTPPSMQVIRSGTQAITKWWATAVAAVGGLSGLAATIYGFVAAARDAIGDAVLAALIGGASLVLSATAIAVSLFVKADLGSRGNATAARHAGRAEVAAAFLQATATLPRKDPDGLTSESLLRILTAFPNRLRVTTTSDPNLRLIKSVGVTSGGKVQVELENKEWVLLENVDRYTTAPP